MKKNRGFLAAIAFAIAVSLTGGAFKASAVGEEISTSEMSVSPMNQELILSPGETYRGVVKVTNPASSDKDLDYIVFVGSFSQYGNENSRDDYAEMDVETVTNYNQIMEWITLDREGGLLAPNNTDEIVFTIRVPYDAPAGGQYATILVRDNTPKSASGGNAMIESNIQMASIIYAEVVGTTFKKGEVLENSVPAFSLDGKVQATSLVKNDGNIHAYPEYVLQVWPAGSDEEICTNEENPLTDLVMPETEKYVMQECQLAGPGAYLVRQTVKIFDAVSVTEQTVLYAPLWMLFIIIFAIILIVMWFVAMSRKRKNR